MANLRLASRVNDIRSFQVMDLLDAARALEASGVDVVHMEVGEPDFVSADVILEAGRVALDNGATRYTSALGLPELRQGLADYYLRWHGVSVDPGQIVVTAGASGALMLLSALLLEPGDELLLADPGYPCNRYIPLLAGARPRLVPVGADSGYQLDANHAAAAWTSAARGMLVASPANPTGTMLARSECQALLQLAAQRDGWLLMDEIYQGLVYPRSLEQLPADSRHGDAPEGCLSTVLSLPEAAAGRLFVLNSFSKYFGMTGWRVGWMVLPPELVPVVERLAQNFYIAPSTVGQHAALAALSDTAMEVHETRRRAFCERRNCLVAGLRALGIDVPVTPEGAFYVYADVGRLGWNSVEFCEALLQQEGVAVTPGTDFGTHRAGEHVRFAYTAPVERIEVALARIGRLLERSR